MLWQCVQPDQKDWVSCLPAVELAIDMARSDTTRFSPFYLNYGQMPWTHVWPGDPEYLGIQVFVCRMKEAVIVAYNMIITPQVEQTQQANKWRWPAVFVTNDLAYLSTKNLLLPKG
ncbi:hypothetical protein GY45DRAFT_1264589 [Cubamyces sp. BRFM 1775]|nr:hypothetical protein GY45DRAFT_1264589 [Cubamyces sp. BRFM 1775]